MKWTACKIDIHREAIEAVTYMLTEQGIQGFEVMDGTLSTMDMEEMFTDYVEEGILQEDQEAYVRFYVSEEEDVQEILQILAKKLHDLRQFVQVGSGNIETETVDDEEWYDNWKQHYKPFRIADHVVIKPTWEVCETITDEDIVVEIDPGMAFGSGTHETTSMCIALIHNNIKPDDVLLDVGCGSGILGITAAKLGAQNVVCIDLDKNAVKAAKDNIIQNHVDATVKVLHGNLLEMSDIKAHIIVANIMADVIIFLSQSVGNHLLPGGLFIASGIILDKIDEVIEALETNGFTILEVERMGEWSAIVAKPHHNMGQ
ncbi:50S ribosomal protein L11 methyltransferase [Vallitalea pronyensis]|uniref:Ribosomal protein L11 methyltransferase n=1 Tax=Vallitalea pronyensis TaxID=1348613 RepID=A0A8J8MLS5_9FIRM|nr:50S ribosomal protein L11 methyltransferase [Vallitalea pronyensis]QUI23874.1 50S ribosomal protein L11 methyltransferase [Vallitalea pronyensis]